MMNPKSKLASLILAASAMLLGTRAPAAVYYWDSNDTTSGFGSASGNWGTSAFWSTSSAGTATPANPTISATDDINFGTSDNAYTGTVTIGGGGKSFFSATFGGTGAVNLVSDGTARTLTVGRGGMTMAAGAGAVTFGNGVTAGNNVLFSLAAGAQTWTNASSNNFTINNSAVATFTRVTGATLAFNKTGAGNFLMSTTHLPNSGSTGIIGPWAFWGSGTNTTYAFNNSGTIASYTGGTAAADADAFVSSTTNYDISNTGTTVLGGARTANTIRYTGTGYTIDFASLGNTPPPLTLNGIIAVGTSGTLEIKRNSDNLFGTLAVGSTNELVIAGPQNVHIAVPIGPTGKSLTYAGTGTLILSGPNNYTGTTRISSGTLQIGDGIGGNSGQISTTSPSNIVNNSSLVVNRTGGLSMPVVSGTGSVLITGGANVTFTSVNTFTGGLTLTSGVVTGIGAGTYGGLGAGTVTINTGGQFTASSGVSAVTINNNMVWNAALTLNRSGISGTPIYTLNGDIILGGNAGYANIGPSVAHGVIFNGDISETGGSRSISASGSTLSGQSMTFNGQNTFTGDITSSTNGAVNVGGDGYLGGGSYAGNISLSGGDFTYSSSADQILSGNISGDGNADLTKNTSADSILVLSGTNSYLGETTVVAGTLKFTKPAALYNANPADWTAAKINVKGGATLALNVDSAGTAGFAASDLDTLLGNISVADTAADGLQAGAALAFDTSTAAGGTFTQGNAIGDSTGAFHGAIGLTKLGAGTLVLDETNTYTGPTIIRGGTLSIGASNALDNNTNVEIGAATLAVGAGFSDTVGKLDCSGAATINMAAGASIAFDHTNGVDWTGGSLNITGSLGATSIRFGTTSDGLSAGQLAVLSVNGAGTGTYTLNASGYLIVATASPYEDWAGGADYTADANNDGVDNGLAWILGADNPTDNALGKLPALSTPDGFLQLNFTRENPYAPAKLYLEYGNDLSGWTKHEIPATSGTIGTDIEVTVTAGPPDAIIIKIPTGTHEVAGKLFARLSTTEE